MQIRMLWDVKKKSSLLTGRGRYQTEWKYVFRPHPFVGVGVEGKGRTDRATGDVKLHLIVKCQGY
jgi:hypothetical protein